MQRRKTQRNNLKGLIDEATQEGMGIDPGSLNRGCGIILLRPHLFATPFIRNNLKGLIDKATLEGLGIDPGSRNMG